MKKIKILNDKPLKSIHKKRILLAGATGYIGRHVAKELDQLGHTVTCLGRSKQTSGQNKINNYQIDITNPKKITNFIKVCPDFDVLISCIGSRSGAIDDAWNVEYRANINLLKLAVSKAIDQFILLSAICVQKPKVEFQFAKLAFEKTLVQSEINHTIIRPTAFYKSLSGQINKVKAGKKFIYFDNGKLTSCKPISEKNLAEYICECIDYKTRYNKILPIGGKGPAITPIEMGNTLFKLINVEPKFQSIPSKLFKIAEMSLSPLSIFSQHVKNTQQFLKIANYYATESMLVYNDKTKSYDQNLTPEYGDDTLEDHYKKLITADSISEELGLHKLF